MYWVGRTGDWHDPDNWSFTSGGPGGAGVPNLMNNVIFDAQSFNGPGQIVRVTQSDIFFASMNWTGATGNPVFEAEAAWTAVCAGSIRFITGMTHRFLGNYRLEATTGTNTVQSAGQPFHQDVIIATTGSYDIVDDLFINRTLDFRSGTLRFGNNNINVYAFFSNYNSNRTLEAGMSTITLEQRFVGNPSTFEIGGENITAVTANASIIFNGEAGTLRMNGDIMIRWLSVFFDVLNGRIDTNTDVPPTIDILRFSGNGRITGNHIFDRLRLPNGFVLFLQNGSRQILRTIENDDYCDGFASIIADVGARERAILQFTIRPFTLEGLFLRGIRAENPSASRVTVSSGADGGNNEGWQIQDLFGRFVYWVGGTGNWNDRANWSETSGGSGGACIPSGKDRVFFDANSFSSPNDTVFGFAPGNVDDITYSSPIRATLSLSALYVNNDITLTGAVNWQIPDLFLIGNDELGTQDRQRLATGSNTLINLFTVSEREIRLDSDLNLSGIIRIEGNDRFYSAGFDITTQFFYVEDAPAVLLNLANSCITVTGSRVNLLMPLVINNVRIENTQGTIFKLTAQTSGLEANTGPIGSVYFTDPDGDALLRSLGDVRIETLRFEGDGELIETGFNIDSLFFAAGHDYRLSVGLDIRVNQYFEGIGGPCAPIGFSSNAPGFQTTFSMPSSALLNLSYFEIRDLIASGGADFFAGTGSVSLGGNSGWRFPTEGENDSFREFLGRDTVYCSSETIILRPFEASEILSIVWNDGSTNLSYTVPSAGGEIIATVTFPNMCEIADTVQINFDLAFTMALIPDTTICDGQEIALFDLNSTGAFYRWSTGDSTVSINIREADTYTLLGSLGACRDTASMRLAVTAIQFFDLGRDTSLCEGQELTLVSPTIGVGRFTWNDGSSALSLVVSQPGTYWLELQDGQCTRRDSIDITFDQLFDLSLGADSTLCTGETLTLTATAGLDRYLWEDGSTDAIRTVSTSGVYTLLGERGACRVSDSVAVNVVTLPPLDLGADRRHCESDILPLVSPITGFDLLWSTGEVTLSIVPTVSGLYRLTISDGRCQGTDEINVVIDRLPEVNLGGDTLVCEGVALTLDAGVAANYIWSTGDMNRTIDVSQPGRYEVRLENGHCRIDTQQTISYVVIPDFDLGPDSTLCDGEELVLQAPSIMGGFIWSDGSQGQTLSVSTSDVYILRVEDRGCSREASVNVVFDPTINLSIGPDTTLCAGEELVLSTNATATEYIWSTGATTSSINVNNSGTYILNAISGACEDSDTVIVRYVTIDDINLGDDRSICEGESITLNAFIGNELNYVWSDGRTTPEIVVTAGDTYTVEVGTDRCVESASVVISVDPRFEVMLPDDRIICEGDEISLTSLGNRISGVIYQWIGNIIPDPMTEGTIRDAGYYTLIGQRGACAFSDSIRIDVQPALVINLGDNIVSCQGNVETIGQMIPNAQYLWTTGETTPLIDVISDGTYAVNITQGACISDADIIVSFAPLPVIDLGMDRTICAGESINLGQAAGMLNYFWSTGATSSMIDVTEAGTYRVTVRDDNACESSDEVSVVVNPIGSFDLGPRDQVLCMGESLPLTVTSPGSNILWSTGNTGGSITVDMAGIYWAETDLAGCLFRDTVVLSVTDRPDLTLPRDTTICDGSSFIIRPATNASIFSWSSGQQTMDIEVQTAGTYTLRAGPAGCATTQSIHIMTSPTPSFSLGPDETICEGEDISLSVPSGNGDIRWSTGQTGQSIIVDRTGTYTATADLNGCTFSDSRRITVENLPFFNLGDDIATCDNQPLVLSVPRTDVTVSWSTGQTGNVITTNTLGQIVATAVSSNGCIFTDAIIISNRECARLSLFIPDIFSPNGDNTNDFFDIGISRSAVVHEYVLEIFDRMGNKVFISNNPNDSWDGNFNESPAAVGVYTYSLKIRFSDDYELDRTDYFRGSVTMIR